MSRPCDAVALEEFETYALDRIRVLKAIDEGLSKGRLPRGVPCSSQLPVVLAAVVCP